MCVFGGMALPCPSRTPQVEALMRGRRADGALSREAAAAAHKEVRAAMRAYVAAVGAGAHPDPHHEQYADYRCSLAAALTPRAGPAG